MNQAKKYEFMSDYIDGNLTETEIESFFTENEEFKKEIEEVKSVLKEIKSIKPLKLSNSFDVKLNKAIKAYNRKQTFSYKVLNIFDNPVVATVGSVAAAVVLVVVTTIHFSTQSNEKIDISNKSSTSLLLSTDFNCIKGVKLAEPKTATWVNER